MDDVEIGVDENLLLDAALLEVIDQGNALLDIVHGMLIGTYHSRHEIV